MLIPWLHILSYTSSLLWISPTSCISFARLSLQYLVFAYSFFQEKIQEFQLRLIPELRLANITTIEEANNFLPSFLDKYNSKFALCINHTKSVFEKQPSKKKINLTLAILSRRVIDTGHSICFKKKYYRTVNSVGTPIYFGKGTKCMVIEAFDKSLYATVENSIFSLEEIPEVQLKSENFDEILPSEPKKIYIPRMIHPFKRQSFEKFIEKQSANFKEETEKQVS